MLMDPNSEGWPAHAVMTPGTSCHIAPWPRRRNGITVSGAPVSSQAHSEMKGCPGRFVGRKSSTRRRAMGIVRPLTWIACTAQWTGVVAAGEDAMLDRRGARHSAGDFPNVQRWHDDHRQFPRGAALL